LTRVSFEQQGRRDTSEGSFRSGARAQKAQALSQALFSSSEQLDDAVHCMHAAESVAAPMPDSQVDWQFGMALANEQEQ